MLKNYKKGFTLIELLVVIAIIGILSSVVLASLNSARAKGADAAIKADLSNLRAAAELYYDTQSPNSYGTASSVCTGGMFADASIAAILAHATAQSGSVACFSTGTPADKWAVSARLKSDTTKYWCVDSTGKSQQNTTAATTSNC